MDKNIYSTASGSAAGAVQRGVETAGDVLHSGIDKVADPARNVLDRVSEAAHGTVDKLAIGAMSTADRFADQTQKLAEAPSKAIEASKSWVQEKPLEAVGAALAIGFILGRLTR